MSGPKTAVQPAGQGGNYDIAEGIADSDAVSRLGVGRGLGMDTSLVDYRALMVTYCSVTVVPALGDDRVRDRRRCARTGTAASRTVLMAAAVTGKRSLHAGYPAGLLSATISHIVA